MERLAVRRRRDDPGQWARELGVSREAVDLYLASDVVDLHTDSFIWHRIFGTDLLQRGSRGLFDARFWGHADFARMREAEVSGAIWVLTTNPARSAEGRARAFVENVRRLRTIVASASDDLALVRTLAEYDAARATGRHAVFVGIQGGNALDRDLDALDLIPDDLVIRITLVHLTSSRIGSTSSPARLFGDGSLSRFGCEYVRRLDEKRILVDLAHVHPKGFWDAVRVHDPSLPLIVTHTGVSGVHPHWRNIDDAQLRAIARSGGTVGIMFHGEYLSGERWHFSCESVVNHIVHVVRSVGEDFVSLGSDWDGAIITPRDMPTCLELPVLVERMLRRGLRSDTIQKLLGANFLRVLRSIRG